MTVLRATDHSRGAARGAAEGLSLCDPSAGAPIKSFNRDRCVLTTRSMRSNSWIALRNFEPNGSPKGTVSMRIVRRWWANRRLAIWTCIGEWVELRIDAAASRVRRLKRP